MPKPQPLATSDEILRTAAGECARLAGELRADRDELRERTLRMSVLSDDRRRAGEHLLGEAQASAEALLAELSHAAGRSATTSSSGSGPT